MKFWVYYQRKEPLPDVWDYRKYVSSGELVMSHSRKNVDYKMKVYAKSIGVEDSYLHEVVPHEITVEEVE